jgi:uroporphyrin-III C-methyltransferase/precorrin-2 dehydrogenase/sirohydrochlorin ferrochelatase
MAHFPVFFDLSNRPALVVGGGELAARKVRLLRKTGARITVVAPRLGAELAGLVGSGGVAHRARGFVAGDVSGQAIVIAATGIDAVDVRVSEAARQAGIPVNAVDRRDLSDFIVPAIVDRDPIVVAISSAGAAPVLARRLRERIEAMLPSRLGDLARFAERFRSTVAAMVPTPARRRFWERFFQGPVATQILAGRERSAREAMLGLVNAPTRDEPGSVAIVGAGPGDPDLLTLRALRLLQDADVIVHDRRVGFGVMELVRRDAERIFVGKARGHHSLSQDGINALIAERALAGQRVVRRNGGEPVIFGRGGEEVEHLRRLGIAVQVVPGITAATGCAAAAGLPLTHRDLAQSVTFVTAHARDGEPQLDWRALAAPRHTIVVYMGVAVADRLAARLIEHGLAGATPVAIIENGTLPTQRVVTGTLRDLGVLVAERGIEGPAALVIGEVARLVDPAMVEPAPSPVRVAERCA